MGNVQGTHLEEIFSCCDARRKDDSPPEAPNADHSLAQENQEVFANPFCTAASKRMRS